MGLILLLGRREGADNLNDAGAAANDSAKRNFLKAESFVRLRAS
jgi:hypothetical protein